MICGSSSAMMSVTRAMDESAAMMSAFRLYLSAHTPAANEMRNCGRYEHTVNAATHAPDEV